jgi:hypothetical protein
MPAAAVIAVVLALLAAHPAGASWRPPVDGPVTRGFDLGANPYEGGRHRGIDLRVAPGAPVRATCGGPVVVAGQVGTSGRVVTVLCGRWRVTHMPLEHVAVRAGETVRQGAALGTAAASGEHTGLHLGVRRDGTRFGYVDPMRFLSSSDTPPPLAVPRTTRPPRLGPRPRPAPLRRVPSWRPIPTTGQAPVTRPVPSTGPAPVTRPVPSTDPAHRLAEPGPGSQRPIVGPTRHGRGDGSGLPGSDRTGSNPMARTLAPWPAWAGLALVLAGIGIRWRRRPRPPRASPMAAARPVRWSR